MTFKQDALNVWRRKKTKELKVKWEELPEGTTGSWRDTESAAVEELALFTAEGFFGDEDLYPTANAAALSIQFAPSADLMAQVWQNWSAQAPSVLLVQLSRGLLLNCPFLLLMTLTLSNLIVLKPNSLAVSVEWSLKAMSAWPAKEESKEERQDFQERAPNGRRAKCAVHLEELQKFRMSLHQMRSNCKKFVTNVRRKAVKPRSIAIWQDFAEALTTQHQKEVQAMHFGGIVTVHFPDPNDEKKILFHSKQQDSSTVDNHMDKLIKHLKKTGVLKDGGRNLGSSDGCAKQCKCSSALRFMSCLSFEHGVAIECAIGCLGYGKCEVGAINAVDKNTILRESLKTVQDPELTTPVRSKLLQTFTVSNVRGGKKCSAALNCKHVLEGKGAEGVNSMGNSAKRERDKEVLKEGSGMWEVWWSSWVMWDARLLE